VSSGGGCNALWRLAEPIRLDRTVEKAEEVERYNIALVTAFGENNCHDVSRILRMPHTVNWPNETKKKKGRQPALSSVLWESADALPIGLFRQVEPRQTNGVGSGRGRPKTMIPGSVQPITDVAEIRRYAKFKENITDSLLSLIKLGLDAPEAQDVAWAGDGSRLVLRVAGELMRAGVPDPQIFAIITEPSFGCSAHTLKHRGGSRRAAQRAMDRARDTQDADGNGDTLLELNDEYFVVKDLGNKCLVVHDTHDPVTGRKELRYLTPEQFYLGNANRKIKIAAPEGSKKAAVMVNRGAWWFEHRRRHEYARLAFSPGRELAGDVYNLWQGFAVDPVPGDKHLPFLEHIRVAVCDEDEVNYRYLLGWMADAVQNPARPGQVAVVMRGGQGTGKGTVAHYFGKLWGRHYMQVTNPEHLVGRFNSHLADLVVLFADEAFFAGDKEHESVLKTIITEERRTSEMKYANVEQGQNYLHLIMASNKTWVVPTDADDRRYFVLDLPPMIHDESYFPTLRRSMDLVEDGGEGGLCNLLYFFQTYDLSGWRSKDRPRTKGLSTQKMLSLPAEQDWWHSRLTEGTMPQGRAWLDPMPITELFNDYITHATKLSGGARKLSKNTFCKSMKDWIPGLRDTHTSTWVHDEETREKKRRRTLCYQFPALGECRKLWDARMGTTAAWPDEDHEVF
jgi:hypothetical protein